VEKPKHILIAGGSGLIGTALKEYAQTQGWHVSILSRSHGDDHIIWDPSRLSISLTEPRTFDAIINLTGKSLADGRWTKKNKTEMWNSRLDSCKTLHTYLADGRLQTSTYIGASATGIYGNRGQEPVDDNTTIPQVASTWQQDLCIQWEEHHLKMKALGFRTVITRFGLVLSRKAGPLKEILDVARFGMVNYIGSGRQFWPWVHITDVARAIGWLLDHDHAQGIRLVVGPQALTNKELAIAINRKLEPRRLLLPAPRFALAIVLGEMHQMLLDSCYGHPARLLQDDFQFSFPTIQDALNDLM
jgi:uncharacterized protein (TIGR01777 family)